LHSARTQDAKLGLVNDGHREERTGCAVIGQGKGATTDIIRGQFLVASTFRQVVNLGSDTFQREVLDLLDNWHDQPTFAQRHGHSNIDIRVCEQTFISPGGVYDFVIAQCFGQC